MAAERAINMALRVRGIGEVERDFRKVGKAGEEGFDRVEKAANGADKAMSEYTARLKRVSAAARQAFDSTPGVAEARAADPAGYIGARNDAILQRIDIEKRRIGEGLPDLTQEFGGLDNAIGRTGGSLARVALLGAAATGAFYLLKEAVFASAEAYMDHEKALDAFEAELALGGNRSDATASQIEAMAKRIADASLQTEEASLKAAGALAKIPGITQEAMEEALASTAAFADKAGIELPDALERVTPVLQALADRDMKALIDATDDLDDATANMIVRLAAAGDTAGAQAALFDHLRNSAGDESSGLTGAVARLDKAWERLKTGFAEQFAGPAADGLNLLAGALETVSGWADTAAGRWARMAGLMSNPITMPLGLLQLMRGGPAAASPGLETNNHPIAGIWNMAERVRQAATNAQAREERLSLEKLYGGGGAKPRPRGGGRGRSGKSDAEREAERLQREAERARDAADRVIDSNEDVIESYTRRAEEAEAKIGLEGEALAAVERRFAVEAAARRITGELISKEVEARRAEAAAKKESFDEDAAIREVTAWVEAQEAAVRGLAERYADAEEATDAFNKRQAQAKAILEQLKTPMDLLNEQIDRAVESLRDGDITGEQFGRRMDQLAETLADVRYETDEAAQAWRGFGDDVGRVLTDFILDGGSARDVLQQLVRMPLERLLQQQIGSPVADWIDGLTGNNRDKNVAAARALLPNGVADTNVIVEQAAQSAAFSLTSVGTNGMAAAQALSAVALSAGNPIEDLALQTDLAAGAMGDLPAVTNQFGSAMANALAQLAGGGGGSGFLGAALQLGMAAFGGGAAPNPALAGSVSDAMAANPGLFASGTDRLPTGRPFWVGENGRELMELTRAGNLRVHSNQASHRLVDASRGSPPVIHQTINVPQGANPRHTLSTVSRGTQQGLARAARKGLASSVGRR